MMWKIPIALGMTGVIFGMMFLGRHSLLWESPQEQIVCCFSQESSAQYQPFPIVLEDQLVIESLGGYEGPFLEDGTYEEVSDVVAVKVHNQGFNPIKNTYFTLKTDQGIYTFRGSTILSDQTCVLLELSRQPYRGEIAAQCTGTVILEDKDNLMISGVSVEESGEDAVRVTNATGYDLDNICLCYKTYFAQTDTLMGGITYEIEIKEIPSGESKSLKLPFYVIGYSKIIAIYPADIK